MSQQSEDRLDDAASAETEASQASARILRLKSTPYDLQKAIQQRAQESVEREAELDREARRPKPLKWLLTVSIASIPIILTLTMADGFLRAIQRYMQTVSETAETTSEQEAPVDTTISNNPNVILVQPLNVPEQPAPTAAPNGSTSESGAAPQN